MINSKIHNSEVVELSEAEKLVYNSPWSANDPPGKLEDWVIDDLLKNHYDKLFPYD